jgi:indoleacetamide hydrolase
VSDAFNALVQTAPDFPSDNLSPGLGVAVKDNVDVRGMPTRGASPALPETPATDDAPVVAALRAAGMRVVGKTNMHELAFGVTSENPWSGTVENPALPGHIAGGSSGGTAAAIAGGLVDAGLGTDTGGSSRIPAAFCGVVGFRPTTGRYSSRGVLCLSETFDTVGPMGRSVTDVEQLDAALVGRPRLAPATLDGVRLAVPRAFYCDDLGPEVSTAFEAALARLREMGCVLVEQDVPNLTDDVRHWHLTIVLYEAEHIWRAHARSLGRSLAELADAIATPRVAEIFRRLAAGEGPSEDAYRVAADRQRPATRQWLADYFAATDVVALVAPAVPITPPLSEPRSDAEEGALFELLTRNMLPATIAAQPSVCLPIGGAGPPVGLLLDARPGDDEALLALALAVETVG